MELKGCAYVNGIFSPNAVPSQQAAVLASQVSQKRASSQAVVDRVVVDGESLHLAGMSAGGRVVALCWPSLHVNTMLEYLQRYGAQGTPESLAAGVGEALARAAQQRSPPHALVGYPVLPLVRCFGYDGMRMLLALGTTGTSIAFVGTEVCVPSQCVLGFLAALQPLPWLGSVHPAAAPGQVGEIADELGAAVVGCASEEVPVLLLAMGRRRAWIADCDRGVVAPTSAAARLLRFPKSDKLKQAIADNDALHEALYEYWAAHCVGQYRKARTADPSKWLFPTLSGSERDALATAVHGSEPLQSWLAAAQRDEAASPFTAVAARRFPELFPDFAVRAKGAGSKFLSAMTMAKQTIRSTMAAGIEGRYPQYMRDAGVFPGDVPAEADGGGPVRLPMDCLTRFEDYHGMLTPPSSHVTTPAAASPPTQAVPPPAHKSPSPAPASPQSPQSPQPSPDGDVNVRRTSDGPAATVSFHVQPVRETHAAHSPTTAVGAGAAQKKVWQIDDFF